jgi:hypothetical protein
MALACRACNVHKSDHIGGWDEVTRSDAELFHPRQHRWADHFRLDSETGIIHGVTPIGRATVVRLEMNTGSQVEARRLWIRLGLCR